MPSPPKVDVTWYGDPTKLTEDRIDPLLWPAVKRINASGWLWTAECCQGHPEATEKRQWASNVRPMVRLVCKTNDSGKALGMLVCAAENSQGLHHPIECWPRFLKDGWCELTVYVGTDGTVRTAWERDRACEVWDRFGKLIEEWTHGDDQQAADSDVRAVQRDAQRQQ